MILVHISFNFSNFSLKLIGHIKSSVIIDCSITKACDGWVIVIIICELIKNYCKFVAERQPETAQIITLNISCQK